MTDGPGPQVPLEMAPNLIEHRYVGGEKIAGLRGLTLTSERQPEEWLASTVARNGHPLVGLASCTSGELLRDLVCTDPVAWVGPAAAESSAGDVGILFKLLDAGQRLGVHVHPDRAFAGRHLDSIYGKTEAWLVLDAAPGARIHLGWSSSVGRAEVERRRDAQDSSWLLGQMNSFEAEVGMGVLVPAGTVHSLDAGIFVAEVQEPTDLSILLEWSVTTSARDQSHLGLGFDTAMEAVSLERLPPRELDQLVVRTDLSRKFDSARQLLPAVADPFFRLDLVAPGDGVAVRLTAGFAVILVVSGKATLSNSTICLTIAAGQVFAMPHSFGAWSVTGSAVVLVGRPPTAGSTSRSGRFDDSP